MKVELEVSGRDLVLLYLMTGNEDAGRIVTNAAKLYAREHPPEPRRKRRSDGLSAPQKEERCPACGGTEKVLAGEPRINECDHCYHAWEKKEEPDAE